MRILIVTDFLRPLSDYSILESKLRDHFGHCTTLDPTTLGLADYACVLNQLSYRLATYIDNNHYDYAIGDGLGAALLIRAEHHLRKCRIALINPIYGKRKLTLPLVLWVNAVCNSIRCTKSGSRIQMRILSKALGYDVTFKPDTRLVQRICVELQSNNYEILHCFRERALVLYGLDTDLTPVVQLMTKAHNVELHSVPDTKRVHPDKHANDIFYFIKNSIGTTVAKETDK